MGTPLILNGKVEYYDDSLATPAYIDVSDVITRVIISQSTDVVTIPATFGADKSNRAGGTMYSAELSHFANDTASSELFMKLWAKLTGSTKTAQFRASFRDGAVSATNPSWTFVGIITATAIGGDAEGLSTSSMTMPLTGAPVMATS